MKAEADGAMVASTVVHILPSLYIDPLAVLVCTTDLKQQFQDDYAHCFRVAGRM